MCGHDEKRHLKPGNPEKYWSMYKIVNKINGDLAPYILDKSMSNKICVDVPLHSFTICGGSRINICVWVYKVLLEALNHLGWRCWWILGGI